VALAALLSILTIQSHLTNIVIPVAAISSHSHVGSASQAMFDVPRTSTRSKRQAFSVAGMLGLRDGISY
jgi:hypothetical protein